ncbi:MAG: TIGR02300 family protein [Kiloniellales bacterium]
MAKPEWGTKHTCQSCGAKYYDLQRTPITCPKCGTQFDPDALLRSRRGRATAVPAEAKPSKKPEKKVAADEDADVADDEDLEVDEEVEEDENLGKLEEGEEDEDLIEDASELGEDDDDMAEVVIDDEKEER